MDANGLTFRLLAEAGHWRTHLHTAWNPACRTLALASERELDAPVDGAAQAAAAQALQAVPRALDGLGGVARWHEPSMSVVVHSHLPGDVARLALAQPPRDLCVGHDGVLYVAQPDGVLMHDLRGRFADELVPTPAFMPWRLAAQATEGVWILEMGGSPRVGCLSGRPLPQQTPAPDQYAPGVFRPDPENCRPPRLELLPDVPLAPGEVTLGVAFHAEAGLALLTRADGGLPRLHRWQPVEAGAEARAWAAPLTLAGARYAYAFDWLDARRIAVRMPGRVDAPAFDVGAAWGGSTRLALGEVYPLGAGAQEASFAHRLDGPVSYPVGEGRAEPLLPLSLRQLARQGSATHWARPGGVLDAQLLDSGQPGTVWHRLYAEAALPAGTGFVAWLAATGEAQPPADTDAAWQPHAFGADVAALVPEGLGAEVPHAAWERAACELPGHPGLAPWPREPGRRGLFNVLIQHSAQRVRRLVGRYLWVRVSLYGDGRSSPEIAALRAYAGRFDYVDHYLPRLYRESLSGAPARVPGDVIARLPAGQAAVLDAGTVDASLRAQLAAAGMALSAAARVQVAEAGRRWRLHDEALGASWPLLREQRVEGSTTVEEVVAYRPQATPSDFLSRLLANFEGELTMLEDRVAAAHLLTDPAVVPQPQLEWLAGWVGVAFDPALPAARRRDWLAAAPELARWHGTRRGLGLALDVATGGAVSSGEVVVIEDFRLRRVLATLLGVDLVDEADPLMPGGFRSANSVVGDTLVLGDAQRVELLALFRDEVASDRQDDAVRAFYGRLAHRATVLVHQEVERQDLGLIRRIAELEAPAHVEVRVATATWPFLVGVASLVGVDTYLGPPRPRRPVRVQVSALGLGDLVLAPPALDPRMTGTATPVLPGTGTGPAGPFVEDDDQ